MINIAYQAADSAVIIVGGNSGIGLALIELLRDAKATIIALDIQPTSQWSRTSEIQYHQCNPLNKEELIGIKNLIAADTKSIAGLVNLSGTINYFGSVEDATATDWDETFDISFKSCLHSCQVFASMLDRNLGSAIVNMASGLAFVGQRNYGPYSASKAAIVNLSKTLAAELAPKVRVNSVAPGAVNTPFLNKEDGTTRVNIEQYEKMVPLGQIAKPIEIAHTIMYLLSEGASHVTGECLHVNGGIS